MTIGTPLTRPDGVAKLTGAASYAADHVLPEMVDVVMVAPTVPCGRRIINPLAGRTQMIGELVAVGVSAAIANAVFHATGIRVRELPITIDRPLG